MHGDLVFGARDFDDHEHVSFFADPRSRLRAVIAIHRGGPLGVSGGGCRMRPYESEREALRDALRLSRAMTCKLTLAGLPGGGAKAVVLGDPRRDKSEALLLALGRAVDRLGGRFVISTDVGTGPGDMDVVRRATPWVALEGRDTAAATARGVLVAMRAALVRRLGHDRIGGVSVAVQGLGRVGRALAALLASAGARLVVADVDPEAVEQVVRAHGARAVPPDEILRQEVDVLAPCALADALDERSVAALRCKVIAGSANNVLADPCVAEALAARGVLYAPDFVANAGGVLGAAYPEGPALDERLAGIGRTLDEVFARAEREGVSTHEAAERIARERLDGGGVAP